MTAQKHAMFALNSALAELGLPELGGHVNKVGTGYSGPGVVSGLAIAEDGTPRIVVSHRIEGGSGALMHIYTRGLIEPREGGGE